MAIGTPDLVFARCRDLAQELVNRDLHFVVEGVVLSYHQVINFLYFWCDQILR